MYCHECGTKLPEEAKFCFKCGAKQVWHEQDGAPAQAAAPPQRAPAPPPPQQPTPARSEPRPRPRTPVPEPPPMFDASWEVCEVFCEARTVGITDVFRVVFASQVRGRFRAKARGPQGIFIAGETDELNVRPLHEEDEYPELQESVQAVNALIDKLINEGWERTDVPGQYWFSYRLRRRVQR